MITNYSEAIIKEITIQIRHDNWYGIKPFQYNLNVSGMCVMKPNLQELIDIKGIGVCYHVLITSLIHFTSKFII